jgi:pimeloyl-ACP methyl ester carboxylesterase
VKTNKAITHPVKEEIMSRIITATLISFAVVISLAAILVSPARATEPSYDMPSTINPAASYLLFHHNYYVETKGVNGDCTYYDILKSFADKGYTVISEIRPRDVSVIEYGRKAAADVHKLLDAGVPPEKITVAGHSKGGVITLQVAALLQNPKINYAILAGCGIKGLEKGYPTFGTLKGNFLSLYASSDKIAGSCGPAFTQARDGYSAKEIVLDSPAGHQLFFKPTAAWVVPVVNMSKGE